MMRRLYCLVVLATVTSCTTDVVSDIDENEANDILTVLQRNGITAKKLRATQGASTAYTIAVKSAEAPRAFATLKRNNLPHPKKSGLGEIFSNVGLIPSPIQESALMRHALSGEIAKTLQSIDGVIDARVQVVLPPPQPVHLTDTPSVKPRAAVLIKTAERQSPISENQIRQLVVGSVPDLAASEVNVVVLSNQVLSRPASDVLVQLGPFQVASSSKSALLITLCCATVAVLVLALLSLYWQRRHKNLLMQVGGPHRHADQFDLEDPLNSRLEASMALIHTAMSNNKSKKP